MANWYNSAKDGDKFSGLTIGDWTTVNSRVEFEEGAVIKNDEKYFIFLYATSFTGLTKNGEPKWKFVPENTHFTIQRKDIQVYSKKEGKKIDSPQSLVEKWLCSKLDELEEKKVYKGYIELANSPILAQIINGNLPVEAATAIESQLFRAVPIEGDPINLPLDDIKAPEKRSWSGGSGGQKMSEQLVERHDFFVTKIKADFPALADKGFKEIVDWMATDGLTSRYVELLLKVMG